MDYRSSIVEDDHPAAASPWGSSPPVSPHRNGSSFPYEAAAQDTNNGFAQQEPEIGAFQRPDTADGAASTTNYDPSHQSEAPEPTEQHAEASQQQQHPHAQQPKPQGQDQPQHARKSTGPQYKLQAKITGLERTGRKDPILRFDVHVGAGCRNAWVTANTDSSRPIYPNFEPHNSATCAGYIPSSSSLLST